MKRFPCFLLLLLAAAAPAQKLAESIEVHVINVDVIVTDKAGNHVRGLTKNDFELFENGKAQTISNFYEVAAEPVNVQATPEAAITTRPTDEARSRRFILFIDNDSIDPFRRNSVFDSLERFTERELRPGDQVTVVTWNRTLHIALPLTSDQSLIRAALATAKKEGATRSSKAEAVMAKSQCEMAIRSVSRSYSRNAAYAECHALVDTYAESVLHVENELIRSLRITMSTLAGVEGKRIVIFAGSHLPQVPGRDLYEWLAALFPDFGLNTHLEAAVRSQFSNLDQLGREANADGITFYPIDTAEWGLAISADQNEAPGADESFVAFTNTASAYQALANMTGGAALTGTTNFDLAFQTISSHLSSYYSLGYKPANEGQGERRISVRMKNRAYNARSRRTFAVKTTEEQITDRVLTNIAQQSVRSEWPFAIRAGRPVRVGRFFNVPFELAIPPTVILLRDGDAVAGGFTVYVAVGDEQGRMSEVTKSVQPIRIPAAAEARMRKSPMIYRATLQVRGGENTLSVAVVDMISNTAGYQRTQIVAK